MRRLILSSLPVAAIALSFVVLPARAQAQSCVSNISGDWNVPDGTRLCAGTYNINSMTLGTNRTLFIEGQTVLNVARTVSISGLIDGVGAGASGGAGCSRGTDRGGGSNGGGDTAGQGRGAPSYRNLDGGGAGGGGGGYGNTGGGGGTGNAGSTIGTAGSAFGSLSDPNSRPVAPGGGGASCSSNGDAGGGRGGAGGASLTIIAKDIQLPSGSNGRIENNGAPGTTGQARFLFWDIDAGAGGGGGAGGTVSLYASEQLVVGGRLSSRGGNGGTGARSGSMRGGGGGGAGGRVKLFHPFACASVTAVSSNIDVAGGSGGSASGSGSVGGTAGLVGTQYCANIQAPPTVSLAATPSSAVDGEPVLLSATGVDPNGHLIKYEFDCDGDGTFEIAASSSASTTCTYALPGTYTARVRASDWNSIPLVVPATPAPPSGVSAGTYAAGTLAFGGSAQASATITVVNGPPRLTLSASPDPIVEGDTVTFTLSAADSAGDAAAGYSYTWTLGDGTTRTASGLAPQTLTHTYSDNGTFVASVVVKDRHGAESRAQLTLNVQSAAPTVSFGPLPTVTATQPATFTATASDPSSVDLAAGFEYVFNWGDSTPPTTVNAGSSASVTKTFANAGTYTITVQAKDKDGVLSAPATATITVLNFQGPTPPGSFAFSSLPAGFAVNEGSSIELRVEWRDPNTDDNQKAFSYKWEFGDGTLPVEGTTGGARCPGVGCTSTSISHVYAESGSYTVRLSVTDQTGLTAITTQLVTVRNVAPVVLLDGTPNGSEGSSLSFSAKASDTPGDTAAGFSWTFNWGDGSTDETFTGNANPTRSHTFADNGTYTVRVTARDRDNGVSTSATLVVSIANVAPTATLDTPAPGIEGSPIDFSASAADVSSVDTAAGLTFEWDFGDGSPRQSGKGLSTLSHTYVDDGQYTVTLVVSDKDGGQVTKTVTASVKNAAPTVTLPGDLLLGVGEEFSLTASGSDPGSADPLSYSWTLGDGTNKSGESITHSYSAIGEYTITVTVIDGDGGSASHTVQARVVNRLPVATEVRITPEDPRTNDPLTVVWTFSDPDGDAERGTSISWRVDGQALPAFDNQSTIPFTATARGQVWVATVTPHDGTSPGLPVESPPVTIGNDAPVATNLTLTPLAPKRADTLVVSYSYSDPDGDREDASLIRWTRNGEAVPALDDQKQVPGPLTKGDVWQVSVTPNDGADLGDEITSAAVTIRNTAPTLTRLEDIARPASDVLTEVTFVLSATDLDGDSLSYECTLGGESVSQSADVSLNLPVGTHLVVCTVSDGTDSTVDDLTIAIGDVPPVVDAGPDRIVDPGRPQLNATARDALGRTLSYSWRVVSAPASVTLDSPNAPSTSMLLRKAGDYTFEVSVKNGIHVVADTVLITVRNIAPVADAGPAIRHTETEAALRLDASASSDANGDTLSYSWTRVSGPGVRFEGPNNEVNATIAAEASGELVMQLTVSDGELSDSTTVSVRVTPVDGGGGNPPVARAGPDQRVLVGELVTLDGSESFDVDAEPLEYSWRQRLGTSVTLSDASAEKATFTALEPGLLTFELTVSDGSFVSTDEVRIEVIEANGNTRPLARVSPESQIAPIGGFVTLDGSESSDAENDPLSFKWRQVSGPTLNIEAQDESVIRLLGTSPGVAVVELVVNDGHIDSHPVFAEIIVSDGNERPIAIAKADEVGPTGLALLLDGSESYDPEGLPLTYAWTQLEGPSVLIGEAESAEAFFTPSEPGDYVFSLVVRDGLFSSEPALVHIEVLDNGVPVALIDALAETYVEEPLLLDAQRSSDPEGAELSYSWRLVSGPEGAELRNADTTQASFLALKPGVYSVALVVNDGAFDSAETHHVITVRPLPELVGGCGCNGVSGASALALAALGLLLVRRRRQQT